MRDVQPRHHTPRSDLPTRGGQVAKLSQAKGRPFMPWQQLAADVALEYDPDTGLNRYSTIVVTVQRQSGKTTWVGTLADHRCLSRPDARVWITMQSGKMANSWMRNSHLPSLKAFGDGIRPTSRYKRSLRAEETGVIWRRLDSTFFAFPPKEDALHSQQSDLVIVSEAWAHDPDTGAAIRQAYRPTMITRPNAQVVIESTRGDDSSVWFDGFIDLGISSLTNPASRVCIIDYGIPEDADPEDLDVIAAHHPAYGHTITMQSLIDAREEFRADPLLGGAAGWARAYGNRASHTREVVFTEQQWTDAARPRPAALPDRVGIAVDATPDGDRVACSLGWRADNGHGYADIAFACAPIRELPTILTDLSRKYRAPLTVCRDSIGTVELIDAVVKERPSQKVKYLSSTEYGSACVMVHRGLTKTGTVHHFNDTDLDRAVKVLGKRDLGDGAFGWRRKTSAGSVAEMVSWTIALKAFDLLPARRQHTGILVSAP